MKKLLFISAIVLLSATSFAQKPADQIIGIWETTDSEVKLKFDIYKSGESYFGKLLYASTMYETDGKTPKKDVKNPDKSLRSRSRLNIVNINNLTYNDGDYSGGTLYNPDSGDTYRLKAKMINNNNVEFRGYVGISLLGKTMKLKRVQ